ncbi:MULTISPECIES: AMP-binding protein [unclassified Sphingopyxis]|uniref:AMP-binding protein n=1 Tax=unclassified Sphingopyxis TaxID=2614943 RepID=UPI002857EC38|nr:MULTISPECIES: AMP-binding protein [unclassified Sphingopyxis]MDR6834081.1 propionyl-CoA synthetase [Sphingopyxis sp. BE122]MDR7226349.1 propionyl-CoA synthetase [Sphingopyxis sp. BE259]
MNYDAVYAASVADPAGFWMNASKAIDWDQAPTRAGDAQADGIWTWFPDGRLNTCHNAIDRHVAAGRGDRLALIHDSAMTGTVTRYTYADLQREVARVAGMIRAQDVALGDRVIIYMPMVPEAVFAMLACARIGAVHSVVFGGFASHELAKRIDDAEPKLVLTASCGLEPGRIVAYKPLLDEAIALAAHKVPRVVVLQRPQLAASRQDGRDLDWVDACAVAAPADCVAVASDHPLYILYTSGTTGIAKGVVHDNGGHAVAMAWSVPNIYGVGRDEVFWAGSDIGWAVGHSYIVYGPLIHGCTSVMYEGKPVGTPDAGAFWRVIRDHQVDVFFTAPTAIRAVKREDAGGRFLAEKGSGRLRALYLAGERADPDTLGWAEEMLGIPVIDHWWQTELGWPALGTCIGLGDTRTRHGSAGRPIPGYGFAILDGEDNELAVGEIGDIVLRLPLPPGCFPTLWQRHAHFQDAYLSQHAGYYTTGDAGLIDEDGFVHVMSRIDDIINVAGHRLSTGSIEQIVSSHPAVAECAVIGANDDLKGMVPVGLVVLKAGIVALETDIAREIVQRVRDELGPVAAFKRVHVVTALPKTRSGKILRSTIRAIANGENPPVPATIDDACAFDHMYEVFAKYSDA